MSFDNSEFSKWPFAVVSSSNFHALHRKNILLHEYINIYIDLQIREIDIIIFTVVKL